LQTYDKAVKEREGVFMTNTMKRRFMKAASAALAGVLIVGVFGGCATKDTAVSKEQITAIINAKIFDGENFIDDTMVVIKDGIIQALGGNVPEGAIIIDADGGTLMPGLIDSHTHTDMDGLRDALKFGVTTELEMQGSWSKSDRKKIAEGTDMADLRSPGMGVTPKGGHPTQYMANSNNLILRYFYKFPSVSTVDEAVKHVDKQISDGADYIKILIEDGTVVGYPGLPVTSLEIARAATDEAHRLGKMVIAHVTIIEGTKEALDAGVDGLGHLFFDLPHTKEIVDAIKDAGVFVIPTLVTASTAFGNDASVLAADPRVSSRLDKRWLDSLSESMNVFPDGKLEDSLASVKALHDAGVDILAGSDVSEPIPGLGGLAHGVSLHHELQLLVEAGFTPTEALRAATSVPARRFGLTDRGRIAVGARADLLLVDGDPLNDISDTLSINTVWRGGVILETGENDE
jgi:imidazolonepropionase-like amidohydrolase